MAMIAEASYMVNKEEIEASGGKIVDFAKGDIARNIGMFLLKEGYIEFDIVPDGEHFLSKTIIIGSLGVSSKDEVAALKAQLDKARVEAVDEAFNKLWSKVRKWGSFYDDTDIAKNMVLSFMGDVLKEMKK